MGGLVNSGCIFLEASSGIHGSFAHVMQEWLKVKAYQAGHFTEHPLEEYKAQTQKQWKEVQDCASGLVFASPVTFRALEIPSMLPLMFGDSYSLTLFRLENPSVAIIIERCVDVAPVLVETLKGASEEVDHIAESLKKSNGGRGR
jgi:hypothetical protein